GARGRSGRMGARWSGGAGLRRVFTLVQFVITLAMLAGAVVFYQQMYFMFHKDPGLDRTEVLEVGIPPDSVSRAAVPAFAQALRGVPGVREVSLGSGLPTDGVSMGSTTVWPNHKKREMLVSYFYIDPLFLPMLHIRLAAGRNVSDSFP